MADIKTIKEGYFEDSEANTMSFFTCKSSIIGFNYPDTVVANDKNYKYIRVGLFSYNSPDVSSEVFINENFNVAIENGSSDKDSYKNTIVNNVHITGVIKGNRVIKSTFKCVCDPVMGDAKLLEIYLTEERNTSGGITSYHVGVWVNVLNTTKVYLKMNNSHSMSTNPSNRYSFTSGYIFDLLEEDYKSTDVNTSNVDAFINSMKFCTGTSSHNDLIDRLVALETKPSADVRFGTVVYDTGFEPILVGSDSLTDQIITPTSITTGLDGTRFLSLSVSNQYFSVVEDGIYMVQICSKFVRASSGGTGNVKVSLSVNNDEMCSVTYNPINLLSDGDFMNSPMEVLSLTRSDMIRLKFKFADKVANGTYNDGTVVKVTKIQ